MMSYSTKNVGKAADKSVKDAPYASDMKGKSPIYSNQCRSNPRSAYC